MKVHKIMGWSIRATISKKERRLNIEALRTLCIGMLVIMHGLLKFGVLKGTLILLNNISWMLKALCIFAVNCFFPILSKSYWFMTTYFVIELLWPLINAAISQINCYQSRFLVAIMIFFFSMCPSVFPVEITLDSTRGYGIVWSIT